MSAEKHTSSFDEKASGVDVDVVQPDSVSLAIEERRLVRKIDWRIIPIACAVYLFAFLDRSNLGNARLQGLPQDTLHGDPTGVLFDWVNSAFFFSYIICQVPATLLAKLCPPRIWLGCAVVGWGMCSALMSTAFNFPGLMVARIGLGAFEACFAPGIPLYLSYFYTKEEIGKRLAFWFGFAAVAGAFGGLIAFGIQNVHAAIANWRLLFIIEGVPTVLFGLLAMIILPNRPEETSMFNEKEREIALERMNRGYKADVGRHIAKSHIYAAFKDWRVYTGGVLYFGVNCAVASITAFLPTIITTFGVTNARAQLLTVPPYAVAVVVLCITAYFSDRQQSRGVFIAAASTLAGIGYVLLLTVSENIHVRYFATFCITSGTYTSIGVTIAWFAHNLGSETKQATGTPIYQAIGQCGSVLGSHIFPATEGPQYIKGFAVSCALQFLGALAAVILTISYRNDNKRRDEKYGEPAQDEPVDTSELADKAPGFRYVP
ncbi:MFS general substrate transporter [Trametes versicolor FP-101664 SS1]|uniref:MFS general substrate transporter n=1 Tax=Trametes versicolor (strain FP-101664) TaxID=717944 RepID=UPI0004622C85|nr:MFS general substrate transporter [Trametes versicolor FP-101664 SS1]EIW55152.1 MFS general substrate transporter [Trametes versicolor FP-101664 SS1]